MASLRALSRDVIWFGLLHTCQWVVHQIMANQKWRHRYLYLFDSNYSPAQISPLCFQTNLTQMRSYKVQYISAGDVESAVQDYLSDYGSVRSLEDGNLIIIEDLPPFLQKIEDIIFAIDREPKQIMIEAKILEISLTDNQAYGLDWALLFNASDGEGSIGTRGLATRASAGLFAEFTNDNVELVLTALKERGRLRTISTPKLLAMEGLEAETVVGANIGYRVTTTINQVTSESVEFLETGIILKVIPSVDRSGRILLDVYPEVSAGIVSDDGIPSKSTTQVSTRMLVPDGRTVFLGGLIKHSVNDTREGVPGLGDLPVVGGLFSSDGASCLDSDSSRRQLKTGPCRGCEIPGVACGWLGMANVGGGSEMPGGAGSRSRRATASRWS